MTKYQSQSPMTTHQPPNEVCLFCIFDTQKLLSCPAMKMVHLVDTHQLDFHMHDIKTKFEQMEYYNLRFGIRCC